jgi:hypothetical protein
VQTLVYTRNVRAVVLIVILILFDRLYPDYLDRDLQVIFPKNAKFLPGYRICSEDILKLPRLSRLKPADYAMEAVLNNPSFTAAGARDSHTHIDSAKSHVPPICDGVTDMGATEKVTGHDGIEITVVPFVGSIA